MIQELWTNKHKPETLKEIAGQNKTIQDILSWLHVWKPGKALFLYGPPGVGKNLIVELAAKERGYDLLQINASDERKQKDIESIIGNSSNIKPLFSKGRYVLIDEVDGISGNDRGAVTGIIKIIKESRFPVFITANDPWKQKLRPLRNYCKTIRVGKVRTPSVEKRLREICEKEGIDYSTDSLKNLARWSQGDMRSAVTDLQMICYGKKYLDNKSMESLGFRERENELFNVLPTLFHAKSIKTASKLIWDSNKDPDEVFWWIEQNMHSEIKDPEKLIRAFDSLSKADIFRALVSKQQNWRFKAFMVDMMSSVSLLGDSHGYVPYKPPKKIMDMGKTRMKRMLIKSLAEKIGIVTHNSTNSVKRNYFPLLKFLVKHQKETIKKEKTEYIVELEEEELKLLSGY